MILDELDLLGEEVDVTFFFGNFFTLPDIPSKASAKLAPKFENK